jgi:hypothetical protein
MNEQLFNEYLICRERGHTQDYEVHMPYEKSRGTNQKKQCKYCKTIWWIEIIQNEQNIPKTSRKGKKHE